MALETGMMADLYQEVREVLHIYWLSRRVEWFDQVAGIAGQFRNRVDILNNVGSYVSEPMSRS